MIIYLVQFSIIQNQRDIAILSSGSGKSTLLNCIGALEVIDEGDIRVDGTSIRGMGRKTLGEFRRKNIGYIFQFYNLLAGLT
ncbi:MAG: ATP-binding cassette domain-containing protein, partial [Lachnospiraceae bacterium]|nr:ATP-binding cassette domain-containing protein [Lachnospiraceae bacterium]